MEARLRNECFRVQEKRAVDNALKLQHEHELRKIAHDEEMAKLERQQKMAAAKKTFLDMIHKFPDSELGYKGLLSIYLFDGKEAEGQKELESLAERNAQLAPYLVLIQSAVARQDVTAAKQYHDKAKVFKADDPAIERLAYAIRYVEAVLAMQQRNFDEARSIVASILSSEPDNLRLLSFLVELEIRAGNTHEAAKVLKQVENVNPTHLAVSLLKGDLALANKDLTLGE